MKKPLVLVLESDEVFRRELKGELLRQGYEVIEAGNETPIPSIFRIRVPDLAIVGSRNGSRDELEMAHRIREWDQLAPLILTTQRSSEERAIAAPQWGPTTTSGIHFLLRN